MGSSHHLKRLAMPRSWPLPRKTTVWIARPRPGAHSLERCIALSVVMRDILEVADTSRETRRIIHNGHVMIDGRIVKDSRQGVGLMDVLTLGDQNFRCVLDENGKLRYRPISKKDATWKICKIENKTTIKGGMTQLNLHDGRNLLVKDANKYNTGDTLKLNLPDQKVLEHIPFVEGAAAYLIGGSHVGELSHIKQHVVKRSTMSNEVVFENFSTIEGYVFLVNKKTQLPGIEVK